MSWEPLPFKEIDELIQKNLISLTPQYLNLWNCISIEPEKWKTKKFINQCIEFWVVALYGKRVIWYNDIEEGFNVSKFSNYGEIDEYWCNQDELHHVLYNIYSTINIGIDSSLKLTAPRKI